MEKLCEVLNFQAMISLQRERFTSALESLKRAEELSGASLKLKATTLNNLACFYRRTGKLRTAYNYLQNAFELELKIGSCPSLADTHLNLCAVLSQLGKSRRKFRSQKRKKPHHFQIVKQIDISKPLNIRCLASCYYKMSSYSQHSGCKRTHNNSRNNLLSK